MRSQRRYAALSDPDTRQSLIDDLDDLYENAPCGYATLTSDGRIFRVNRTLLNWLDLPAERVVGKRFQELLSLAGRMVYETHTAPLLRMQGGFDEVAIDLITAKGDKLPMIAHAVERRDSDGHTVFSRITLSHGGLRRRYEMQIAEARAASVKAEQETRQRLLAETETSELREQFIAVLGHDLRNPLASISAGARILLRSPRNEVETSVLRMMETTVIRMAGLIDNVMDFARGRLGGGITLSRDANRPLEPVLLQVVDELRGASPERVIETRFSMTEPVNCDRTRIGQLVSNLLGNALMHGSVDQPIFVQASTAGGMFELSVSNSGEPIPERAMGKLFEPFVRGDVRDSKQGLGLGLYIASQIAKAHEGTLTVSSTADETRFTLTMPLRLLP
jgi:sigma-B regulation protein RsbU (phosphoserine phosphatase)